MNEARGGDRDKIHEILGYFTSIYIAVLLLQLQKYYDGRKITNNSYIIDVATPFVFRGILCREKYFWPNLERKIELLAKPGIHCVLHFSTRAERKQ